MSSEETNGETAYRKLALAICDAAKEVVIKEFESVDDVSHIPDGIVRGMAILLTGALKEIVRGRGDSQSLLEELKRHCASDFIDCLSVTMPPGNEMALASDFKNQRLN